MRSRLTFILGAFTALALVTGAAWAAMPAGVDSDALVEVADAGTVAMVRDGSSLEITAVSPATGWSHEVEVRVGREVEVDFRKGARRIQMNAEIEDGEVRVRIRERVQASATTSGTIADVSTSTTLIATTSTSGAESSTSTTAQQETSTTMDDPTSTTIDDDTTSTTVEDNTSTTIDDDTTSTTIDDSTSTTVEDNGAPAGAGTETYSVGAVASVTIAWADGHMTLVSVSVTDGWSIVEQDLRSDRIELELESGHGDAEFRADFHHGAVRVETKVD